MDEPAMKAQFSMNIVRHKISHSISFFNSRLTHTSNHPT